MRFRLLIAALIASLALTADAGQDPNVRRGIAPGNAYQSFDIDTINQFNGSLVLRIPIADRPVGPMLTQALQLTYNSAIYDYQFVQHRNYPEDSLYKRRAIPETFSNSGLGWTLSLGRLVAPRQGTVVTPDRGWHYRSSTGSEHDFTLGMGDIAEAVTHDGSFLRLKRYPSNLSQTATHREIEMPDGTIHRFNTDGYLTEIRDRLGHTIEIDYSDSMKWVIRNKYDGTAFRTTTVNFETRTPPSGTYQPNFAKVVKSIDVPAFNGATASYDFFYEDNASILRDGCGDYINYDPTHFAAPLLKEVHFPEGLQYEFAYQTTSGIGCSTGLIKTATLPSRGSIEWTQQVYQLSQKDCDDEHGWVVTSPGVHKRIVKDAAGTTVGEWTYATDIDLNPGPNTACGAFDGINWPYGPAPTEITTTVTAKEMQDGTLTEVGGKTIHYFAGTLHVFRANALGYKVEEYGFPFTRRVSHSSNANRFLSTERLDELDTLVRSTYVTYKGDATNWDSRLSNARVQGELAVFNADTGCASAACRVDVDRSETDYDGYGHYRKAVTTSNFGSTHTTFTNYTPSTDPWILGTYDTSWVEEGSVARKQLFTFDGNGVLKARRTLVGTAATADLITTHPTKDLLEVSCRDTRGFLTSERFFGGDGATALIPTGDPCAATPAATEYQIDHAFTFNTNFAPTKHTAKYSGMPFFIADEDLDVNTGLVSVSRDVSGIGTTLTYDTLGRPKEVKPTGLAWTLFEYTTASGTTVPASLRITTRASGSSSATPITDAYIYYDSMGRPIQAKQQGPSDDGQKWATTKTVYDLFGRRTRASVPEFRELSTYESAFAPAEETVTVHDVFGRPKSVTGPDGKTRTMSYTGSGVRKASTTAEVALATGAASATSSLTRDAYGRVLEIEESNGTKTVQSYNVLGLLSKVCQNTTDSGVTCGQSRVFTYDNRGLLTSEAHPETGTSSYTYDARGHVLSKAISGDTQSEGNLKFVYDAAERLEEVQTHHPTATTYRAGKVFTFGSANTGTGGANKKLGKPTSATRYNYNAGELTVKETYDYIDTAGRLSKTTTEVKKDSVVLQTLEQSQTYDASDAVGSITYPTCITVSCGAATWNTASLTYTNGLLTAVDGFAVEISYTAAGAVAAVDHAGPVTDTYTPDETGARPKSITFEGHSTCTGPTITTGTPANRFISPPGGTATLTVSASGANGFQWYEGNGTKLVGQTGSSYTTPALFSTKTYYVEAYNDCSTARSGVATVNVCPQLSITSGSPPNQSIAPEETATLTVSAANATTFQWYESNGTPISGETSATFTTPQLTTTKTYYVIASNVCESRTSRTVTVTVRTLPPPTGLVATAINTSAVSISWNSSTDAHHYVLERKSLGSGFIPIQSVYGTNVTNSSLIAGRSYLYRVRAVSPNEGVSSAASTFDLATTMTFTPLVAGETVIAAVKFEELMSAVNAVRAANGNAATTWSAILPPGVPVPAVGAIVYGSHLESLRSSMNNARTALGLAPLTYTDPTLSGVPIKVLHMNEIRGGVE